MPSTTTDSTAQPRHAGAWAALTYALATLMLAWPALTGQFLVNPISDQYIGGFPVREFAGHMVRETGSIPLWNPYLYGGMPYVASMNGDIFYPTYLLRVLLPVDVGMTWGFVIHLFLAGFITFFFLRAMRMTFAGSLVGGLAYMLSGQISSLASPGHDGKLFIAALFPLMLLCIVRGVRDQRPWAWGALALVSGLGVLTPHPQLYQYMLLGAGAFGLFVAFDKENGLGARDRGMRLGLALGAVLLGWLIGAIQFAPVLEYIDWSPRSGGKGWDHAVSYSMPIEELINTYLPQFSGILERYWGRNGIHFHSEYIGASVLLLAGAGFGWGRRKDSWFWLGMFIVATLWALGGYTPFYRLVYAIVPGATYFRAPSTFFFIAAFAVAVFAGRGTERLIAKGFTKQYLVGWGVFGLVVTALGVSGVLREMFSTVPPDDVRLTRFHDPATQADLARGALRSLVFLLATIGLAWAATRKMLSPTRMVAVLTLVIAIDLWSVERLYWRFSAPASELYGSDAIIEHLRAQPEPGRVFVALVATPPAGRDPFLGGDAYMVHRLRLAAGYHGNQIGRYDRLLGERQENALNPMFWQLANVRWFIYNDSMPITPSMRRVMGPVLNAAGTPTWLFRVDGENPAAWVVPAKMKQPDDVSLQALSDPRFPVRSIVLFAPDAPVESQALTSAPAPLAITTRVPTLEPGHIVVELSEPAPAGATLVVSENFYPGWTAKIDGADGAVHRANLSLMGVPLPAGARKVELTFASERYQTGKLITIVSVLLAIAWAIGGVVMSRRRVVAVNA